MSDKINLKKIQDHFKKISTEGLWGSTLENDPSNGVDRAIKRLKAKHPDILVFHHWMLEFPISPVPTGDKKSMKMMKQLAEYMHEIVEETNSVGLAANQIGVLAPLLVFRDLHTGDKFTCINPTIAQRDGKYQVNEMCLSLPGEVWKVKRSKRVVAQYLTSNDELVTEALPRRLSLIYQHEFDHLNGVLICHHGKKINV